MLGLLVLGVAFGTLVWPIAINDIDFSQMLQGPSAEHPFGTDDLGQDILARMIYGGRISLVKPSSESFLPAMTLDASFASGTPIALLTNGTVREARGLTSRT